MKSKIYLLVVLAYFIAGCSSNHDHDTTDSHEHEVESSVHVHEEQKIQITAYSNDIDLFAEADPFIVGHATNILSHLTTLDNFKPVDSAQVTLSLITGDKVIKQVLDHPTRKGIYSFEVTPATSGPSILRYDILSDNYRYSVESPVKVYADEHDAHEIYHQEEVSTVNATVFTKEQSWKVNFKTELPGVESFGQVIKTSAQVQPAQGDETIISAKVNGIVNFTGSNVLPGQKVGSGQLIASITGDQLSDNNSAIKYTEAVNNYEKAKTDYERQKELAKDKIVSERELSASRVAYENYKAIYDNLKQNFSSTGQRVSSPMSGFVKNVFVENGQYIEAGDPILSISQNKNLLLTADVRQKYASILPTINSAVIVTKGKKNKYTLEELNGQILSHGRNTNNDNYLIPVNIQIENKVELIPGEFVDLYLKTVGNSKAITVPNTALLEEQGMFFVFVQLTPELFEKRGIEVGATDGIRSEVINGLKENERVISRGALLVKLSQASGALDPHAGHVH
jgi:RND family efflux transporter MFP subunit